MPAQMRLDQIRDLVNRWEEQVGFSVTVADWMINEMAATDAVSTLYDIGQYMSRHIGDPARGDTLWATDKATAMPWAKYGLNAVQYDEHIGDYGSTFLRLTGQSAPQDLIDRALHEHGGTMKGAQFETWLMSQESIKNAYGWLRYGMDFQQFQSQKLSMRTSFGRDLTDEEAGTQLRYHHGTQGAGVGGGVPPTPTEA